MDYYIIRTIDHNGNENTYDFYCESVCEANEFAYDEFDSDMSIKCIRLYQYDLYCGSKAKLMMVSREDEK